MTKAQRSMISDTVDGVLYGWKHQADLHSGSASFAVVYPGPTFTLMADGKLHKVVETHLTTVATLSDVQEMRDAIAAGQVEIYRQEPGTKRKVILHSATGLQLQPEVRS
ncbi:TPA: hypothetical protein ACP32N_005110 [Pseudomonas aeruginosa]